MRTGVASDEVQFTVKEDAGLVSRLYQEGFVKTVNRVAAKERGRYLNFTHLGWGDEEGAVLVEALRYAAEHCAFPHGDIEVDVGVVLGIQEGDQKIDTSRYLTVYGSLNRAKKQGIFPDFVPISYEYPTDLIHIGTFLVGY